MNKAIITEIKKERVSHAISEIFIPTLNNEIMVTPVARINIERINRKRKY
jgi:hypothetical protein